MTAEPMFDSLEQGVTFFGPSALEFTTLGASSGSDDVLPFISAVYLAAITAPLSVRNSSRDVWNNPKIPSVNSLVGPLTDTSTQVRQLDDTSRSYTNLIGIPIGNLTDGVNSTLEVESINLYVTCTSSVNTTLDDFANTTGSLLRNFSSPFEPVIVGWQKYWINELQAGGPTAFLYATNQSVTDFFNNASDTFQIFYGARDVQLSQAASVSEYTISPVRLRANVTCQGLQCEVTAIRKVPLDLGTDYRETLVNVLIDGSLPGTGLGGGFQSTPTSLFLADPATVLSISGSANPAPIFGVSLDVLSERMSLLLNAYYYAAATTLWAVDMDTYDRDYSAFVAGQPELDEARLRTPYLQNVTAQVTKSIGVRYVCHNEWFAIALITSSILGFIAIANIVLRFKTTVPDLFGYASSMTLHNELCRVDRLARSTALDGLERAVELRDVKFRIADVRSDSEVGRIAFVPVSGGMGGNQHHGDVKRGRLYD